MTIGGPYRSKDILFPQDPTLWDWLALLLSEMNEVRMKHATSVYADVCWVLCTHFALEWELNCALLQCWQWANQCEYLLPGYRTKSWVDFHRNFAAPKTRGVRTPVRRKGAERIEQCVGSQSLSSWIFHGGNVAQPWHRHNQSFRNIGGLGVIHDWIEYNKKILYYNYNYNTDYNYILFSIEWNYYLNLNLNIKIYLNCIACNFSIQYQYHYPVSVYIIFKLTFYLNQQEGTLELQLVHTSHARCTYMLHVTRTQTRFKMEPGPQNGQVTVVWLRVNNFGFTVAVLSKKVERVVGEFPTADRNAPRYPASGRWPVLDDWWFKGPMFGGLSVFYGSMFNYNSFF